MPFPHALDFDEEEPFDEENFDDERPDTVKCGCKYCPCLNDTEFGETCSMCLGGAHQG